MNDFSGKFVLRVPRNLHQELHFLANRLGESLNGLCVRLLGAGVQETGTKSDAVGNLVMKVLAEFGKNLVGVVLFGSAARGDAHSDSDIDTLLVVDRSIPVQRSLYTTWLDSVEPHVSTKYEPQFVHAPEEQDPVSSLWAEIATEGIVVWEKNWTLSQILAAIRRKIARGDIQCRESHGQRYWIHKTEAA